jgi:cell pole-organizing protein PopZ
MEEILASIRRIISEDDAPGGEEAAPEPAMPELEHLHTAAPPTGAAAPAHDEDVLELTDRIGGEAPQTLGDLEIQPRHEPEPEPEPLPAPPPRAPEPVAALPPVHDDEHLVGNPASEAAALAFGRLSSNIAMPAEGRTLEDVVRELLRPLLKQWLDENLPAIVHTAVSQEVERISRTRVR